MYHTIRCSFKLFETVQVVWYFISSKD